MSLSTGQKVAFGLLALGALGFGGYLWWKKKKSSTSTTTPTATNTTSTAVAPVTTQTSTSGIPALSDVTGFQNWYNSKTFILKLVVDGILGPLTSSAYAKAGAQYLKEIKK